MDDVSDEPISRFYSCMRLRCPSRDNASAGAPPLLLIHGGRDHARSWDWVARALRRDFHILAPDLRGHGDSDWAPDGHYSALAHVQDLAEMIHELRLAPLAVIGHSFGGTIAMRYAALYPDHVLRLIAIEGLGAPPDWQARVDATPIDQRMREWIEDMRRLRLRAPRRYASIEAAAGRMAATNRRLSPEQARHLTEHAVRRNEDGSYSWKFDPLVRNFNPVGLSTDQRHLLWQRVACPTLLMHGTESWASNPKDDGSIAHFGDAHLSLFEGAGHWVHHDELGRFITEARAFLVDGQPISAAS